VWICLPLFSDSLISGNAMKSNLINQRKSLGITQIGILISRSILKLDVVELGIWS
jgi:hypothetical protein